MTSTVAIVGASGFIGRSAVHRLRKRGAIVRAVSAPRLAVSAQEAVNAWRSSSAVCELAAEFDGCDVVVNCAGNPDASSRDLAGLFGANAALPGVVAAAAKKAGATRVVHVSSAAVQGAKQRLDATGDTQAFSAYARSKIEGERAFLTATSPTSSVIYRPPSVHSPERRVTRGIRRLATSPLASVVGSGISPTPQAHIDNVGDAIAELALTSSPPPSVVIHPWEGWTTGELMRVFGSGREPHHLPAAAGSAIRRCLRFIARSARLAPNARRVEMMWFGQEQADSWLTSCGWTPPAGRSSWVSLVAAIDSRNHTTHERGN